MTYVYNLELNNGFIFMFLSYDKGYYELYT